MKTKRIDISASRFAGGHGGTAVCPLFRRSVSTLAMGSFLFAGAASANEMLDLLDALPGGKTDRGPALAEVVHAEADMSAIEKKSVAGRNPGTLQDLSVWDDERFQKAFLASYGANAEIEPRVSAVEREQLQKVMDIMSEEDDLQKAMKQLRKVTKESSSALFDFTIGNLYFQQDELPEALGWYDRAIAKFPTFRRAYKNAGLIHVRNGDFGKALPFLTKVVELGGHTSIAYGLLGFAYGSTENHLCAESAYRQAILLDPETVDWQLGLARSFFKQQKFGDAAGLCETLIQRQPDNAEFWLLQANAYLGLKQPMKAAENYEYVNAMGQATSASMTMLADIYINEARWDMAADAYLRAYELDRDNNPATPLRAAKILASRGSLDQSKRMLNRVAEKKSALDPAELKELLKLQARVAVAEGGGAEAVKMLEEVVEVDPLDGEALILLAQHYGRNVPEKAIFYYERAANIESHEAEAKLYHGQLLVGQAKYGDALPLLRRAYELKPRPDIEDYVKQVERIAKTRG
ncbi:tetratricopeptide repeat protein [Pontiella sp.]|uniref:tetratricopeptide repeat protein n=1 Tax=Pontiella sp. TaxID=2837462 RepID=UPI0035659B2F